MPGRNQPRSSRGRSAIARKVINTNSTNGIMYQGTCVAHDGTKITPCHNFGGMKKGGSQPSATGFMRSQPYKMTAAAKNKNYLFNMRYFRKPSIKSDKIGQDKKPNDDSTHHDVSIHRIDCSLGSCSGINEVSGCIMKTEKGSFCCTDGSDNDGTGCNDANNICSISGNTFLCNRDISICIPTPKPSNVVNQIKQLFIEKNIKNIQILSNSVGGGVPGLSKPTNIWEGYQLDDFWKTLDAVTKINNPIYLGTNLNEGTIIISAMLANFMWESANFNICDESNWGPTNGPLLSCGQFGNNYTSIKYNCINNSGACPACEVDKSMSIDSTNNKNNSGWAKGPPMKCGPDIDGGHVAGCCWWGRGPTQLTGPHNIQLFKNWLSDNSNILGTVPDLCKNPGLICQPNYKTTMGYSLVWLSCLNYWITSVQSASEFRPQFKLYIRNLKNAKLPIQETTDLENDTPASWPSGVGSQISLGTWSNLASQHTDRICGFIRMLKLLGIMDTNPKNPTPLQNATDCNNCDGRDQLCCKDTTSPGAKSVCWNTTAKTCTDKPPSPTDQVAPICNLNNISNL